MQVKEAFQKCASVQPAMSTSFGVGVSSVPFPPLNFQALSTGLYAKAANQYTMKKCLKVLSLQTSPK